MPNDESNVGDAAAYAAAAVDVDDEDSGDENDGGLFLANGTYLNDVPDDESNDGDAADAGDDDVDSDASEEISLKETVQAKGNGAVSKKRGKRGGKRIRLDTSVLDAVAALDSDGSDGSEYGEDGSAAAASFQGSRTTFDSDSEDEGGASKPACECAPCCQQQRLGLQGGQSPLQYLTLEKVISPGTGGLTILSGREEGRGEDLELQSSLWLDASLVSVSVDKLIYSIARCDDMALRHSKY